MRQIISVYRLVDNPYSDDASDPMDEARVGERLVKLKLRGKIVAVMAIPFVVLVADTGALLLSRGRTNDTLESERHTYAVREALQSVLEDMIDAETGMRGYLLTGAGDYLKPYEAGVASLDGDLDRLQALASGDADQIGRVDRLRTVVNVRVALLQETRAYAPVTNATNLDLLDQQLDEGQLAMEEVRDLLSQMRIRADELLAARHDSLDSARRTSFLIGLVVFPIALLASLLFVLAFAKRHVNRIRLIEANARRLEDGLPMVEADSHHDELSALEQALVTSGNRVIELQGELQRLATMDPLTRLANRRGFVPMAEHQLETARRHHRPLALMFVDLDGLKRINDTKGHATGDWAIAETAYVLRATFRASDLIARMGGDEFCVLFEAASAEDVEVAQKRLADTVAHTNRGADRPYELSFSSGVASFDPEAPVSLDELMAEADSKMYASKRAGRESVGR
jgi:diguanylate cyclase (GGDEF)-like protein